MAQIITALGNNRYKVQIGSIGSYTPPEMILNFSNFSAERRSETLAIITSIVNSSEGNAWNKVSLAKVAARNLQLNAGRDMGFYDDQLAFNLASGLPSDYVSADGYFFKGNIFVPNTRRQSNDGAPLALPFGEKAVLMAHEFVIHGAGLQHGEKIVDGVLLDDPDIYEHSFGQALRAFLGGVDDLIDPATGKIVDFSKIKAYPQDSGERLEDHCFLAGTNIRTLEKYNIPIESIKSGDEVLSFSAREGISDRNLHSRKVTKIFRNNSDAVIDLRGLHLTPNHVCLASDGNFKSLIEILVSDECLVNESGDMIRARTGELLNSKNDLTIKVVYFSDRVKSYKTAVVRLGIPVFYEEKSDGLLSIVTLYEYLEKTDFSLNDYNSNILLNGEIYDAVEWPAANAPLHNLSQQNWVVSDEGQNFLPDCLKAFIVPS